MTLCGKIIGVNTYARHCTSNYSEFQRNLNAFNHYISSRHFYAAIVFCRHNYSRYLYSEIWRKLYQLVSMQYK